MVPSSSHGNGRQDIFEGSVAFLGKQREGFVRQYQLVGHSPPPQCRSKPYRLTLLSSTAVARGLQALLPQVNMRMLDRPAILAGHFLALG